MHVEWLRHVGLMRFSCLPYTCTTLGNNNPAAAGSTAMGASQVQVQGMAVPSFMHLEILWS